MEGSDEYHLLVNADARWAIFGTVDSEGRDMVSALTPATLAAFRDHGRVQATIEDDFSRARAVLERLLGAGVKVGAATRLLEAQGLNPSTDGLDGSVPCRALRRGSRC